MMRLMAPHVSPRWMTANEEAVREIGAAIDGSATANFRSCDLVHSPVADFRQSPTPR